MNDMITHWYKLRDDATACARIRDLAIDNVKRELFTRLTDQFDQLAGEIERTMAATASRM